MGFGEGAAQMKQCEVHKAHTRLQGGGELQISGGTVRQAPRYSGVYP